MILLTLWLSSIAPRIDDLPFVGSLSLQVIDVLTYKGDGVAEKRQNENGKIDYFVAREI